VTILPLELWFQLKIRVEQWLSDPSSIIFFLLGLTFLAFLASLKDWRKLTICFQRWQRLTRIILAFGLGYLLALSPPGAALAIGALALPLPADSGVTADTLVVLGRGPGLTRSRAQIAAQLWYTNRASQIFVSGNGWETPALIKALVANGIPQTQLQGERCSRTTEENALNTATVLLPQAKRNIILITDPPHMLRSLLTFRSLGFHVIPHMAPFPSHVESSSMSLLALREYLGLVSYGLLGRYQPRSPDVALPEAKRIQVLTRCWVKPQQ
jgi:uncharacterized SAM-binding protein YcdF (DUF218 family)